MARIRSIKPGFWSDEKLTQLAPLVRMTFLGLISAMSDDSGRCKGEPRLVKAAIWPLDDAITPVDVENHLGQLAALGRIRRYEHEGACYLQIVNWKKHQRIDKPRASELPPPPKGHAGGLRDDSPTPRRNIDDMSDRERSGADKEGSGIGSGAEGFGDVADLDPIVRDDDRAAPPAPLVELPPQAEQFAEQLYSLATEKRRLDVRRQLYDTLDPRGKGARLRRGVYVKARSPEHLAACCAAVLDDRPRNPDAAIVIVLEKLQDPPPGATPAEQNKAKVDAEVAEEEAYQRAARAAGVAWARDHPHEYEPIRSAIDAEFPEAGGDFMRMARGAALTQRCARAAGFPEFTKWRATPRDALNIVEDSG